MLTKKIELASELNGKKISFVVKCGDELIVGTRYHAVNVIDLDAPTNGNIKHKKIIL